MVDHGPVVDLGQPARALPGESPPQHAVGADRRRQGGDARRTDGIDHHQLGGGLVLGAGHGGRRDERTLGLGESQDVGGDPAEHVDRLVAGEQLGGDIARRLDPRLLGAGLLIEPGVVDRDAGRGGQRLDEHLVVVAERSAAGFLGEIQIAVDLLADPDRHPEEGVHRRVVRREAHRSGVVADLVEADRLGIVEQNAQHADALGCPPDLGQLRFPHAGQDEVDDLVTFAADAEGAVSRVDEFGGGLDDGLQRAVQVESGGDHQHGFHQPVEAVSSFDDVVDPVLHFGEKLPQSQLGGGVVQG